MCGERKNKKKFFFPWQRGAVDIAFASGTRRPVFESRQGIRFLGKHSSAVVYNWLNMNCLCVEKREIKALVTLKKIVSYCCVMAKACPFPRNSTALGSSQTYASQVSFLIIFSQFFLRGRLVVWLPWINLRTRVQMLQFYPSPFWIHLYALLHMLQ
jgi:hypothetical protein